MHRNGKIVQLKNTQKVEYFANEDLHTDNKRLKRCPP